MKLCDPHDEMLRAALVVRGLDVFVADSAEEIHRRYVRMKKEGLTVDSYEPFSMAQYTIARQVLGMVGPSVGLDEPDGEARCPVCYLQKAHDLVCEPNCGICFDYFIAAAADEMLDLAKDLAS